MRPRMPDVAEAGVIYRELKILPGSITRDLGVMLIEFLRCTLGPAPGVITYRLGTGLDVASSKDSSSSRLHRRSSDTSIVKPFFSLCAAFLLLSACGVAVVPSCI